MAETSRARTVWEVLEAARDDLVAIALKHNGDPDSDILPYCITVTSHGQTETQGFEREADARAAYNEIAIAAGLAEEEIVVLPPQNPEELWATYLSELRWAKNSPADIEALLTKFEKDPLVKAWIDDLDLLGKGLKSWAAISLRSGLTEIHKVVEREREEQKAIEAVRMRETLPGFGRFG